MTPPALPPRPRRRPGRRAGRPEVAPGRPGAGWSPAFERLEARCVPSSAATVGAGAASLPVDPTVQVSGDLSGPGGRALYRVTLDTGGLLVAGVHAPGGGALLTLQDAQGGTLIQGEATSSTGPDGRVAQHLPAGTYYLAVSGATGSGTFGLSTAFTASLAPGSSIVEGQGSYAVATADVNGDGKADLIVPDYYDNQVLINDGLGDGTFQVPVAVPVGGGPTAVLAAYLGDGHLDLVVVDQSSNDVTILEGDGAGNFRASQVLATRHGPVSVVAGDFSGDGTLDLAVAVAGADGVEVFHNRGDGTFVEASFFGPIAGPTALAVVGPDDNGRAGLAVASGGSGSLVLLAGRGNDSFQALPYQLPVGAGCSDVIAADFSPSPGGVPDLAAVSPRAGTISLFHYDGFAYRPRDTLKAGTRPERLAAADFNGDGKLDLACVNYGSDDVSISLGRGDGTFGGPTVAQAGSGPIALAAADFDGDGHPDLAASDFTGLRVSVLLNNGDATFQGPPAAAPSAAPEAVVVADLTGNGISDLIVPEYGRDRVAIFLGRGDGTFRGAIEVPAGAGPDAVAVGDFDGDGIPDLAVADEISNTITILRGEGDGTFQDVGTLATGNSPQYLKAADLDGDGHPDLVVANYLGDNLDVFYGLGGDSFSSPVAYPVGVAPSGIAVADLNGDGRPDIAVSDSGSDDVAVLVATGPRTYAAPARYPAGPQPWEVTAGDFTKDGHVDLIVANYFASTGSVSLLAGVGDGTFRPPVGFGVGDNPYPVAVGDFNGDGHLDVVAGNDGSNDLSVLLGRGDGTFSPEARLAGGTDPYGVAVGDFNGDGRPDLVAVNYLSSDLTVYLGNGDGGFQPAETTPLVAPDLPTITANLEGNGAPQVLVADPQQGTIRVWNSQGDGTLQLITTIQVGGSPSGMAVGDFNGDGRPDLAVTDEANGEVLILLGLGDGTFQGPIRYGVGKSPRSPVVGDLNRDGLLDLAVADNGSDEVSVLYGRGDGTFGAAIAYPVGLEPVSLVVGDANGDGYVDLGTANRSSHDVTGLYGQEGGGFATVNVSLPGISPSTLLAGDFNGDGQSDLIFGDERAGVAYVALDVATTAPPLVPVEVGAGKVFMVAADLAHSVEADLVVANADSGLVTILEGWSGGTFASRRSFRVGVAIAGLSVVDLNNDGNPDILITEAGTGKIETYLSDGNGMFSPPDSTVPLPRPSPYVAPDGGLLTIDGKGQLLRRDPLPDGLPGEFSPAQNLSAGTDLAYGSLVPIEFVQGPGGASIASDRPILILRRGTDLGIELRYVPLPAGGIYTSLAVGDFNRDGRDDLVVLDHGRDQVLIYCQDADGNFRLDGSPIRVGFGPTDVAVADLNHDGWPDILVTNGASGDLSVIRDGPGGVFLPEVRLPGGLGAAGTLDQANGDGSERSSPDEPIGVAAGVFGPSGLTDVVVVDHGTDRISILQGTPGGGLADPSLATTYATGLGPVRVLAAPLGPDGRLDLVVLNSASHDISVFMNDGRGGFVALPRVDAGDDPTGVTARDVNGDGVLDLLVCNQNGDLLILTGRGDGTFQPYQRADQTVSLAVGDLTGGGQTDFVLSNTSRDLLTVQTSSPAAGFLQGRGDGLLAPGPVAIADMNGDGIPDLIVTNTGGNDVFVYLGLGGGQFAEPQRFYTGTAPVGLTVADLNGNGLPDLVVANSGSNDVTILLGTTGPEGSWTMVPGPRLKAGHRPVSTTVVDVDGTGDGHMDILVVNQDSDTVTVLRGLGGGFFDDNDPQTLPTGQGPVRAFVGHFSGSAAPGIVVLDSLSDDMTYFADIGAVPRTIASGGLAPVAGVMGDFNDDGYADLAVANNGDSRVALFDGGPGGLALAQTISLGAWTHPTDLVVTGSTGGGLRFFVGAEGQDHAIPISFAPTPSTVLAGPAPADGGPITSGGLARTPNGPLSATGPSTPGFLGETASVANVQAQEASQAGGPSGGEGAAAPGPAASVVSTVIQAAQPLFTPSSRALGWLLDNLMQLAQGQAAEILPLGKDEMAAVAVLLSSSSMANPLDEARAAVATEVDGTKVDVQQPGGPADPPPSPLDRFVADLGFPPADLPGKLIVEPVRLPESDCEWVWHRRPADASATTAAFEDGPEAGRPALDAAHAPAVTDPGPGPGPSAPGDAPAGDLDRQPPLGLPWFAAALAAVAALAVVIVSARGLDRRALGRPPRRRARPGDLDPVRQRPEDHERDAATWAASKARSLQDLPPWLAGPKNPIYRPSQQDRSFAATFFRGRGQAG